MNEKEKELFNFIVQQIAVLEQAINNSLNKEESEEINIINK